MSDELKTKIEKLPKWAKEHIHRLERRLDDAVGGLKRNLDGNTPSKIYVEDYYPVGGHAGDKLKLVKQYVQSDFVVIEHAGVRLGVATDNEAAVRLTFDSCLKPSSEVVLAPRFSNSLDLVNPRHQIEIDPYIYGKLGESKKRPED